MTYLRIYVQQPARELIEGVARFIEKAARGAYPQMEADPRVLQWRLVAFSDHMVRTGSIDLSEATAVVAYTKNKEAAEILAQAECPAMNLQFEMDALPRVHCDDLARGRMAAEYFQRLGLRHALLRVFKNEDLEQGFRETWPHKDILFLPARHHKKEYDEYIHRCQKPCAVFCGDDGTAVDFINDVIDRGYTVPGDFLVCGNNNNVFQAHCAAVPLTSIDRNMEGMAEQAARSIYRNIYHGEGIPQESIIPPKELVERRSTNITGLEVDVLGHICRFMLMQIDEPLKLEEILTEFRLSRSSLERLFKQRFGQSPGAWLLAQRLKKACELLRHSNLTAAEIASECGFNTASYFSRIFKKKYGCSPLRWRQQQDLQ